MNLINQPRLSAGVGVSIPSMDDAPSCGTGGNAGLVFCGTSSAPWMYGDLMFIAAV